MSSYSLMSMETQAVSLKHFTWHKKEQSLTAEDSQLRDHSFDGTYPWMQQVWSDSCDVGIAIRSHVTGKVEKFYLDHEDRNRDGDVAGWYFKPVDSNCPIKQVLVIND